MLTVERKAIFVILTLMIIICIFIRSHKETDHQREGPVLKIT
jgi:hypothetical protein